ncbi:unnamed protein product [Darwinula stevensoni]|uniref:Uncharacterized protein n=1 Tax=Darwinula stevensoni TaxID=69355 RepID=A0A7R8X4R2_9CRUS|nr:unnamed protein product [Darwinula stevensoni]CAG0886313.1 unnamed protein product [Darwinula stevensoni]
MECSLVANSHHRHDEHASSLQAKATAEQKDKKTPSKGSSVDATPKPSTKAKDGKGAAEAHSKKEAAPKEKSVEVMKEDGGDEDFWGGQSEETYFSHRRESHEMVAKDGLALPAKDEKATRPESPAVQSEEDYWSHRRESLVEMGAADPPPEANTDDFQDAAMDEIPEDFWDQKRRNSRLEDLDNELDIILEKERNMRKPKDIGDKKKAGMSVKVPLFSVIHRKH